MKTSPVIMITACLIAASAGAAHGRQNANPLSDHGRAESRLNAARTCDELGDFTRAHPNHAPNRVRAMRDELGCDAPPRRRDAAPPPAPPAPPPARPQQGPPPPPPPPQAPTVLAPDNCRWQGEALQCRNTSGQWTNTPPRGLRQGDVEQARRGRLDSIMRLAAFYNEPNLPGGSRAQAVQWFRVAANMGDVVAINQMGIYHHNGWGGLRADQVTALGWFQVAAARGNASGFYNVGLYHHHGLGGLEWNPIVALHYYERARSAGQPEAVDKISQLQREMDQRATPQTNIPVAPAGCQWRDAVLFCRNDSGPWLRIETAGMSPGDMESAMNGEAYAAYRLGTIYADRAMPVNRADIAALWFRLAAEQDDGPSQYQLGVLYFEGLGVERNRDEAFRLWALAARNGHVEAQELLARNNRSW